MYVGWVVSVDTPCTSTLLILHVFSTLLFCLRDFRAPSVFSPASQKNHKPNGTKTVYESVRLLGIGQQQHLGFIQGLPPFVPDRYAERASPCLIHVGTK